MKIEITLEGYWLACGNGPLRYIVAEGGTRQEASFNWIIMYGRQVDAS